MKFLDLIDTLSEDSAADLRRAVELGKWPDGSRLDTSQRQQCMQALIAYESKHLPEDQRSGFMPVKGCSSDKGKTEERVLNVAGSVLENSPAAPPSSNKGR